MNEKSPYVGRSAFAHKGGMHIDGVLKNPHTFEHVPPERVGNHRRYLISEQAGRGALMLKLAQIAPDVSRESEEAARIMAMLKSLEAEGYSFEDADASLELRILGALNRRREFFRVLDFHVISQKPEDSANAQAYVKVAVDGQVEITADEGDGPVNALDRALRKALLRFYPLLGGACGWRISRCAWSPAYGTGLRGARVHRIHGRRARLVDRGRFVQRDRGELHRPVGFHRIPADA